MTNPTSPPEGTPDGIYLSIVVPLFNEEESLEPLCEKIDVVLQELGRPAEVIFIDDGSTDDSYAVIEGLAPRFGWLRAVRFRRNNHKAAALATGFREARGELIVTMDADLQDDPAEIPNLIAALSTDNDLVSGWKKKRHDPISKRAPSRLRERG